MSQNYKNKGTAVIKEEHHDLAVWELNTSKLSMDNLEDWKPGDPIEYVNADFPEFDVPEYKGERYQALVPDTLDLQDRAFLAINALTEPTDPLADYEMYFFVYFLSNPPMMQHSFDSHCMNKFMEALPLMRIITGSDYNSQVDRRWMEVVLKQQDNDGLMYMPIKGRPWAFFGMDEYIPDYVKKQTQFISPAHCGRLLSALILYYKRDGSSLWRDAAIKLADGLCELAVYKDDYAYFSPHIYWAEKRSKSDPAETDANAGMEVRGVLLGFIHLYKETGYKKALLFAEKLLNYILKVCKGFDEDGRFNAAVISQSETSYAVPKRAYHFHMHVYTLLAILEYATATGNKELIELVRKSYEYGKANGNTILGYFPEFVGSDRMEHSELCEVADMIALGLKLTEAGVGDYLDDVDRWTRNMFTEGQLTRTDWINSMHRAGLEMTRDADVIASKINPVNQTTDRVAERNLGAFAGWPKANDWYTGQGMGIMHCCTGNASRAIYYIWENILTFKEGNLNTLDVNLLLNRASRWADINSHIPYTGQVDIKIKERVKLRVRIPEWTNEADVRCTIRGVKREITFKGRYADIGEVDAGDELTMTFPIYERTEVIYVEKEKYILVLKGNDVVNINPPGKYCPLYKRDHYRENSTRWKKTERFVSAENILW